jgi:hypothetical protein
MKKLALAAILALPFTAIGVQEASAAGCCSCKSCYPCGGCTPTYRIGFSIGLCWRGWALANNVPCAPCAPSNPCGGLCCNPFLGGYGPLPGPPAAAGGGIAGGLPPWYQYYPASPGAPAGPISFPTPAPTGYPYGSFGPQAPVGSPLFGANFNNLQAPAVPNMNPAAQVMPCGYYPQGPGYWYGQ